MQKQRLILIIGVVLALIAVFMVKVYLDQQRMVAEESAQRKYEKNQASQTPALFAKTDIPQGAIISPDDLGVKVVPNQFLQPGAVSSLDRIAGMTAVVPISKDEQITLSKLSLARSVGDLASVTPVGKRAISIPADEIASLGGMIRPGDYVDVIAMVPITVQTPEGKPATQTAVMPLFQNVLILAVGQDIGSPAMAAQPRYKSETKKETAAGGLITLALTPQEANLMAFVQEQGKLRLILRSPTDAKVEPIAPASWDTLFQYVMPQTAPSQSVKQAEPEAGAYVEIYRGLNKEKVPLNK